MLTEINTAYFHLSGRDGVEGTPSLVLGFASCQRGEPMQ